MLLNLSWQDDNSQVDAKKMMPSQESITCLDKGNLALVFSAFVVMLYAFIKVMKFAWR